MIRLERLTEYNVGPVRERSPLKAFQVYAKKYARSIYRLELA